MPKDHANHQIRPVYNTPDYWAALAEGRISWEEAEADNQRFMTRRDRALKSVHGISPRPSRHNRPEPRQSRQYAPHMATTAARDDRLTPQAKALLQVIRARCGKGLATDTCKTTLANIMSRSARSIQRYLSELRQFGYIKTEIRCGYAGLYTGLRIWIKEKVLPFFVDADQLAEWLLNTEISGRTVLSPKNGAIKRFSSIGARIFPQLALPDP